MQPACQSSEPGEKDFYPPSVCGILRVLRVLAAYLFRAWDFGAEPLNESVCPKRDRPDREKSPAT